MLYLVATPIGNLQDISYRAVETLSNCDYILCEDTRHSSILLNHYSIQTSTRSFHKFNESSAERAILDDLQAGRNIALISDAGTPGISDPGERLVAACHREGILVTSIPGPCACISALTLSGLPTSRFQFLGFLPKKASELKEVLLEALMYSGSSIAYESPKRLITTLETLRSLSPTRNIAVAKELTKKFEAVHCGTVESLIDVFTKKPPRGEFVLIISGDNSLRQDRWESISPKEHVAYLEGAYSLSQQDAIKLAAQIRGVPKRDVYREFC